MDESGLKKALDDMGGWISVEDRLPSREDIVLFIGYYDLTTRGLVGFGEMDGSEDGFYFNDWSNPEGDGDATRVYDVRLWMPLPEPPKEISDE